MSDAERTTSKWDAETVIGNVSDWKPKANPSPTEVPKKSFRTAEPGATTIMDAATVMAAHARAKGAFDTVTVVFEPQRPEPAVLLPQPAVLLPQPPANASAPPERGRARARLRRVAELCRDDFRRTPRSVRATLIALPVIAWATLALSGAESEASPGRAPPVGRGEPPPRIEARSNGSASVVP